MAETYVLEAEHNKGVVFINDLDILGIKFPTDIIIYFLGYL